MEKSEQVNSVKIMEILSYLAIELDFMLEVIWG